MSDTKPVSPFAGIKLTDAVNGPAPVGSDQRLFSTTPSVRPAAKPEPNHAPSPRKQAILEARNQGAIPHPATAPTTILNSEPAFDISIPAYKNNTYAFTAEELWAIEDTEQALERTHDIKVTRYNLVRLGVHLLIEDFRKNGERSFVVRRLRGVVK